MTNTIIGRGIRVDGEMTCEEDLIVDGRVSGQVTVRDNVIVTQTGVIEADIELSNIEISGRVEGNITARHKVEIAPGGQAVGDVKAQRILISDGAVFKGNVDMGV